MIILAISSCDHAVAKLVCAHANLVNQVLVVSDEPVPAAVDHSHVLELLDADYARSFTQICNPKVKPAQPFYMGLRKYRRQA